MLHRFNGRSKPSRFLRRAVATVAIPVLVLATMSVPSPAFAEDPAPEDMRTLRSQVLESVLMGGPTTSAAARRALIGTDEEVRRFLTSEAPPLASTDLRLRVLQLLSFGGPAVRAGASAALDGSDEDRDQFVYGTWDRAFVQDERARALQAMTAGGPAVQAAASRALDGGEDAIIEFLATGLDQARQHDERAQTLTIMMKGGLATREMAKLALDGGSETIHEFLTSGFEIAEARDETLASVSELAAQATAAGKEAAAETEAAKDAAEQAVAAADRAKAAAQKAAAETAAAKDSAQQAAAAAGRAADAAAEAGKAARVAVNAAGDAHAAARAASTAAARAASAAVLAGDAATRAYNEASAAALDKNKAGAARNAATAALATAQIAKTAAAAADQAKNAGTASGQAAVAAGSASGHADAAALAADEAGGYSQAAGAEADRAKRNATQARRAAATARRAAQAATALAAKAAAAAGQAATAARNAAAHAEAAAAAANTAADEAGQAGDKAEQARIHANAAITAANAASAAASQARTIAEVAEAAENERLTIATDNGIEAAQAALIADQEFEAKAAWDASEQTRRDAETKELLAAASAPGAPVDVMLGKGREAALRLVASGGPWTKGAAEEALTTNDAGMRSFLQGGLTRATDQDDRSRVEYIAETGEPPALRAAAEAALDGPVEGIRDFLENRSYPGKQNDDRAKILQLMSSGGPALHAAASEALDGTDADRNAFLARGQYAAAAHDERVEILAVLSDDPKPGPEVTSAAKIALAGPQSFMRGFLRAGRAQAQDRDYLVATHQARVDSAVAQAAQAAAAAQQSAYEAAEAAARARNAADDAAAYANQAAESARQAGTYATQARASADQAKVSAQKAAASAVTARNASAAAKADARRADQSASDARYSAYRAKSHADDARLAADEARQSAEGAQKSAAEAQAAYDHAYDVALDLIDVEEQARRDNPPPKDARNCDRPPGYGADQSCYPSLPGLTRQSDDGDILCWSWAENQKQCGYTIVTPEERRQFELDRKAQNMLNACALFPSCFMVLSTVMPLDPSAQQDPQGMLDEMTLRLLGAKVSPMARYAWLLKRLNCSKNSFSADTRVVMADGRAKSISEVRLKDQVKATDPVTGDTRAREVVALHVNQDRALTDVQVREVGGATVTVHTTQEHPFWDATRQDWIPATRLGVGDRLYSDVGTGPSVTNVTSFSGSRMMYNLSIAEVPTYYILAGSTQVLVHNAPPSAQTCDLAGVAARHPGQAHTLRDHVNVSRDDAIALARSKDSGVNGVWTSEAVATRAIDQLIAKQLTPARLQEWFRTFNQKGRPNLELRGPAAPGGTSLGYVAKRDGSTPEAGNEIVVVLKRDKTEPGGYYVYTAYPVERR
ncbi:polymorphic toxin-type HINT domain-containing protein [Micromonospora sp. NPDC049645]|uniref:polymorphic toxin-type HINT domain-containing protein n=1 Tax=Micromonospora sp. NPDC049645 TaxID=3155508 RepID=UPI00342DF567